ncbi:VanZ family protein [Flavobacteriaceae bacterium]|nr:VanZ family protein [Flavobacteriaceae bacterium]
MLKHIKPLLERNSLYFAIICTVVVVVLSLTSSSNVPSLHFTNADKLQHAIAYGSLSFFWIQAKHYYKVVVKVYIILLIIIAFGIIMEFLQWSVTANRTADVYDAIANTIGCLLGYLFLRILNSISLRV